MNSFFDDEIYTLKSDFLKLQKQIRVIGDDFGLRYYFSELNKSISENGKKVYLYPIDFTKEKGFSTDDLFLNADSNSEFVFLELIDFETGFPGGVTALSERELYALSAHRSGFSAAEKVCAFETELKKYVDKFSIKVLRYTNIFGTRCDTKGVLKDIFDRFCDNKHIKLSDSDYGKNISISYISCVVKDIFSVITNGKNANVYNGSNQVYTIAEIKNCIYELFRDEGASIEFSNTDLNENGSTALSSRKIRIIQDSNDFSLKDALLRTLSKDETAYIERYMSDNYDGKINRIREEVKDILLEVERICKKHSINYYLVGGSLLGAVRHNGFIPWDDDVDICMLREDFEKFRKICPSELCGKYAYQSYRDEKSTHYIYDKIRLKGTYFSSEHSGRYDDMENGIFLDIFVFDKTANSKLIQKLHVFLIVMLRRLIHIRWTKEPVTGKFAFISKLILPLVTLLPFAFYHTLFEFILRFFEKSKKSRFVLDGIGLYVKNGALPLSWVTDCSRVNFEGMTFPGVSNSDAYLSMWYGKDYMTPPVISKKMSGHSISKLDLGEYLYNNEASSEISLKGELYDK